MRVCTLDIDSAFKSSTKVPTGPDDNDKMTILPTAILATLVTVSSQQTNDIRVSLNSEVRIECPSDPAPSQPIWEYAESKQHFTKKWYYTIALNGKLDLSRPQVAHLADQLIEDPESTALKIIPSNLRVGGVYRCKDWGADQDGPRATYNVDVIAPPVVSFSQSDGSVVISGKTHQFVCTAADASPKPVISWFQDGEPYTGEITQEHESVDDTTKLSSVISEIAISLDSGFTAESFNLACHASTADNSYSPVINSKQVPVEFAPSKPKIKDFQMVAMLNQDHIITCGDVESRPEADYEWTYDPKLANYTVTLHNRMTLQRVPTALNGSQISCKAINKHGESVQDAELVVVKAMPQGADAGMGSNTILMIGVIMAALVLAILGGIVTYKRCSHRQDYHTREDGKTAGPDGISYEQNPEVEALAPGEEKVQKELLM